jgi:hypothetical protein
MSSVSNTIGNAYQFLKYDIFMCRKFFNVENLSVKTRNFFNSKPFKLDNLSLGLNEL